MAPKARQVPQGHGMIDREGEGVNRNHILVSAFPRGCVCAAFIAFTPLFLFQGGFGTREDSPFPG